MTAGFQCAGCGEWNETAVDPSAGMKQSHVEGHRNALLSFNSVLFSRLGSEFHDSG
jgi:hypothetical protein